MVYFGREGGGKDGVKLVVQAEESEVSNPSNDDGFRVGWVG